MNKASFLVLVTLILTGIIPASSYGQNDWRAWNSFSVGLPLTKNLDGRIAYLRSTDITNGIFENNFNWYQFRLNYEINRNWDVRMGTTWMNQPASGATTNRIFIDAFHRIKLNKRFVLKNGVQFETHNNVENRYDQRIILMSRLGLRRRLRILNVAPSVSYNLYYNIGGSPLTYYNESAIVIAQNSPNGFHRGRILINFNFKLSDPIRLSIYYMNQHEFNLLSSETNKINVFNPVKGNIQRPFNNYNVVGIALSYQLKGKNKDSLLPFNF